MLVSVLPTCVVGVIDPRPAGAGDLPAARRGRGRDGLLGDPPLPRGRGGDAPGAARHQLDPLAAAQRTDFWAVSLRARLLVALPLINLITGLIVAALTSNGGGARDLGLDVLVALAVATTISLELTVLLSKSILRPAARPPKRRSTGSAEGDYEVCVPVTTGDELGELAASFNQMVEGLAERERLREAFGTYLDKEVAEYILSEGFSEEGVEVEVSVLFCDVRDFTAFAERRDPAAGRRGAQPAVRGDRPDHRPPRRPRRQVRRRRPARRLRRPRAVPRPRRPRRARRLRDRRARSTERGGPASCGSASASTAAGRRRGDRRRRAAQLLGHRRRRQRRRPRRGADARDSTTTILITGETCAAALGRVRGRAARRGRAHGVGEPVAIYAPVAGAEPPEAEPAEAEEPLPTVGELARRLRPRRPRMLR